MPGKHSVRNDTLCPAVGAALFAYGLATSTLADVPAHNFPTLARVEYVQECINRTGGQQTNMYQCVCVVDRIAESMSYDEFVESSMFAKYSTLPGEGGGLFRDTDEAKEKAKLYRTVEANAFRACNLPTSTASKIAAPAVPATPPAAVPAKDKR
jgi:hypothetical protein